MPGISHSGVLSLVEDALWTEDQPIGWDIALYPGSWWAERERAWYLLFAHVRNYPLLNTCLAKRGRGTCILIHVIDSVTYKFIKYTCTVECSEERNNHTTA